MKNHFIRVEITTQVNGQVNKYSNKPLIRQNLLAIFKNRIVGGSSSLPLEAADELRRSIMMTSHLDPPFVLVSVQLVSVAEVAAATE